MWKVLKHGFANYFPTKFITQIANWSDWPASQDFGVIDLGDQAIFCLTALRATYTYKCEVFFGR